jgi:hypothetical protein
MDAAGGVAGVGVGPPPLPLISPVPLMLLIPPRSQDRIRLSTQ